MEERNLDEIREALSAIKKGPSRSRAFEPEYGNFRMEHSLSLINELRQLDWSEVWPAEWIRLTDENGEPLIADSEDFGWELGLCEIWSQPGSDSEHSAICSNGACLVLTSSIPDLHESPYLVVDVLAWNYGMSVRDLHYELYSHAKLTRQIIPMRQSCPTCGPGRDGWVVPKSGQLTVRCIHCERHVYNAPKWEVAGEKRIDIDDWIAPNQPLPDGCFFVYRMWGHLAGNDSTRAWDQELLYVGQTNDLRRRLRQHAGHDGNEPKAWADEVAQVTVEIHGSQNDAKAAESRAIRKEAPKYNFHYSTTQLWECESSHCQVVLLSPWMVEGSGTLSSRWPQMLAPLYEVAMANACPDGDPIVYNDVNWWFLAVDLPKVVPGSLDCLIGHPGITYVESKKPCEFPVPEPLPKSLRRTLELVEYAPKFPRRDAA
jgi:predicted GIY-YIG superfamily endonuclease